MIESAHNEPSDNSPPASNTPRAVRPALIAALLIAAAFLASNWFFYRQGQRDAAVAGTDAMTAATHDAVAPPSDSAARRPAANDTDGSAQPAADADVPRLSSTDAVDIGTMVVHPHSAAAKANRAARSSRAGMAKSSHSAVVEPENRRVALLGHPKPAYPRQALREHEEGTVLVLAQVDVQGNVSDARVSKRSGSFALDRAATNEVRTWQFQPALRDGKPVVASVEVPVSYRLDR